MRRKGIDWLCRVATALASALISVGACGGEVEEGVPTALRDSAGTFIYESPRPHWDGHAQWSVGLEPILSLPGPGTDVALELYGISDLVRLPDGRIVVAVPFELRVFSPSGEFVQAVGREGDGPGEFRSSPRLGLLGDSLVTFDFRSSRATIHGPDLETYEVVQFENGVYQPEFAILPGGFALLKSTSAFEGSDVGLFRLPIPVVFLSRSGEVLDTLATVGGTELLRLQREDGYLVEAPVFGRRAHIAASEERVVVGDATHLEFRVVDLDGSSERVVRGLKDLSLSAEDLEGERMAILGSEPSQSLIRLWQEMVREMPDPARRPAYRRVEVDPTGAVWLEQYNGEAEVDDPRVWEVFSAGRDWLGQVTLPARFQAFEVGRDDVLGVQYGGDGTEQVQLLPLRR